MATEGRRTVAIVSLKRTERRPPFYCCGSRWNNAMAFIPVADTAKVAITMLQRGQRLVNVFHFTKAGGYTTEAEVNDLAGNFATAWIANIAPLQANTVTGLTVTATDLSVDGGAGAEIAIGDTMCVVSYYHLGVPRAAGLVTPITNSSLADLHIDSQRRRLAGRGT